MQKTFISFYLLNSCADLLLTFQFLNYLLNSCADLLRSERESSDKDKPTWVEVRCCIYHHVYIVHLYVLIHVYTVYIMN